MKKTGSETPANESSKNKVAPAEPVERARLQADVAKQRVRLAKEELKRARKRLKEAKREARRARKLAAGARKAWKQEKLAARGDEAKASLGKQERGAKKKKKAKTGKSKRAVKTTGAKQVSKKPKLATSIAKTRPTRSSAAPTAQVSAKQTPRPSARRAGRLAIAKSHEQPDERATSEPTSLPIAKETQQTTTVEAMPAANAEDVAAAESTPTANGAAIEHGT